MAWYNTNWTYRKKITIDNTKVNANLTDFPVYVDLSDLGTDFFSNVNIGGGDIRITKADGTTELARELVSIDTATLTGELHFKGDALNSTTDTEFYIYYGNAAASDYAVTDTFGRNNVWSSYDNVYHMQEDPSGTAPQIIDSTSNNRDGTSAGSMTSADLVNGQLGKSLDFDGSDDYLSVSSFGKTSTSHVTVEAWVRPDVTNVNHYIVDESGTASYGGGLMLRIKNDSGVRFWQQDAGWALNSASSLTAGNFYYLVGVYDGTKQYIYIDGVEDVNNTLGAQQARNAANPRIGSSNLLGGPVNGLIDEVRISGSARSADWISTQYNNQNSASTFYAVGTQEEAPPIPWYDNNWTYRKKITIDNTKVSANLTDFPIYVDLSDLGTDFFSNVKTDGSDIRITKADGTTELARELVSIDTATLTGELHFKGDALNSTTDTEFYIYYGNAAASDYAVTDTFGRNNVWDSNFLAVYHLDEAPSATVIDSTGNADGTPNTMDSTDLITAQVGNGLSFDGSSDYVGMGDKADFSGNFTISQWVNPASTQLQYSNIIRKHSANNGGWGIEQNSTSTNQYYCFYVTSSNSFQGNPIRTTLTHSTWQKFDCILNGTTLKHLVNNSQTATGTVSGVPANTVSEFVIGKWSNQTARYFNGSLDEIRLSNIARSDDWLSTEYNNQNSASTFYAVGTQEENTTLNIVSILPAHESTGNAIDTNLVITYNKNVTAGTGSLTITQRDGLIIGDGFAGKIGELILTNENLSQDTIEKVEGYLAWKWFGINNPLPDTHPYKLRRPVI